MASRGPEDWWGEAVCDLGSSAEHMGHKRLRSVTQAHLPLSTHDLIQVVIGARVILEMGGVRDAEISKAWSCP